MTRSAFGNLTLPGHLHGSPISRTWIEDQKQPQKGTDAFSINVFRRASCQLGEAKRGHASILASADARRPVSPRLRRGLDRSGGQIADPVVKSPRILARRGPCATEGPPCAGQRPRPTRRLMQRPQLIRRNGRNSPDAMEGTGRTRRPRLH